MRVVNGKFEKDDNFITVYSDGEIIALARGCDDYSSRRIGERAECGGIITQKVYDTLRSHADRYGTFVLYRNGGWGRIS